MHPNTRPAAPGSTPKALPPTSTPPSRWSLAPFAIAGLMLLAACGGTGPSAEQLGAAPSTLGTVTTDQTTTSSTTVGVAPEVSVAAEVSDGLEVGDALAIDGTDEGIGPDGATPTSGPSAAELDGPEKAMEQVRIEMQASTQAAGPDTESLDTVKALDRKADPDQTQDLRQGSNLNESGEPNVFDQAANLACADVEVALTAFDEGRLANATDHIRSAADRADSSAIGSIDEWHPILRDTAHQFEIDGSGDTTPLLAFLSTCTQGGYEL